MAIKASQISEIHKLMGELKPERHVYFFDQDGLTKRIIEETTTIGVAKLKFALRERGYDEDKVLVVYGPGSSVTNERREREAGFEDGIRLLVKDCLWPYINPGCGYYIGLIPPDYKISKTELKKKYEILKKAGFMVDGYKVFPWTDKAHKNSNHFLEIWESKEGVYEPGLYLAIHTEFDGNKRMWSECKKGLTQRIETPLGPVELLEGNDIEKFLREMKRIDELSKKKRAELASLLVDGIEEKFNQNHKRYFSDENWSGINASNYFSMEDGNPNIVPVCFDENLPIYLVRGQKNIERRFWPNGYEEMAEQIGLASRIERINMLMHGGSETKDDLPFKDVELDLTHGQLVLRGGELKTIKDPSIELGRRFRRPEEILPYIKKFGLGEVVGKLNNILSLSEKLY